jgi:hypothetical protein
MYNSTEYIIEYKSKVGNYYLIRLKGKVEKIFKVNKDEFKKE